MTDWLEQCEEARAVCKHCIKETGCATDIAISTREKRPATFWADPEDVSKRPDGRAAREFPSVPCHYFRSHSPTQERDSLSAFIQQIACLPQRQGLHGALLTAIPPVLAGLKQPIITLSALFLTLISDKRDD
ncbi:hypothetical protein BDW66DRAFT_17466 [Aspergillus desertorum]